ncbi:DUF411 domain-containing protein [Cronobacter sakazakii]|uniref:DUF411 domain-containing protein n=1 Tax=Enterobacteriaceae TaxID=543 RepID=UPI00123B590C|nr:MULTISPECIES: DUF411 domain-containing protein [Enterobacteriaceae]EKM0364705.1 DUF411 domain-containing protein [Cronobacter turicensis]ELQ6141384.1 DUF411 domain-containing protein [Cronobacter sakazakii]ELY4512604.1 DUF411 domain-containing protein [Cronobacter dublinensis]HAT7661890.1 DUF411 domain-containing protein [Enterobacter hormaechei subsp. steigerwaltii]ELY3539533.1 DUF411 domain-containing protein [Cronobacter sakazakii]
MIKVVLAALAIGLSLPAIASEKVIDMYKSENCGCCSLWAKAMEKDGFKVRTHVMNDQALSALKQKYSVPAELRSCHTAVAGKLIVEGHVPAATIHRAMQSGSGIYGLATSGMPAGSPGMEMGDRKEAYDVIAFAPDGNKNVFQRIE